MAKAKGKQPQSSSPAYRPARDRYTRPGLTEVFRAEIVGLRVSLFSVLCGPLSPGRFMKGNILSVHGLILAILHSDNQPKATY